MNQTELLPLIQQAKAEQWTELDLRGLYLEELPPDIGELTQLEVLNLGYLEYPFRTNCLSTLPDSMAQMSHLHTLNLSGNSLSELPEWMMQLTRLHILDLSQNCLSKLPDWMAQLTNLRALYLDENALRQLPKSMAQLNNLQILSLNKNRLQYLHPWIAQLTNLNAFFLCYNKLQYLPDWMAQLTSLHTLDLSGNSLRLLPKQMARLTNLHSLNISDNRLESLPDWIAKLANLHTLYISGNHLNCLPRQIVELIHLRTLDISRNDLRQLPGWVAQLTSLHTLDLSGNSLSELPSGMSALTNLHTLRLSHNYLNHLPDWMAYLTRLHTLYLRSNGLSELPKWMTQLTRLHTLDLSDNGLSKLPEWMVRLTRLHTLYLSLNSLNELPEWMVRLTHLHTLYLSDNSLSELPEWMAQLTYLRTLHLSYNSLSELPEWMAQLTHLQTLDLRSNRLSELPEWMAQLPHLHALDLSNNCLSKLPEGIAQLTHLHALDLSGNRLSELPEWMTDPKTLPLLRDFYVGENPLTVPPAEILGEALKQAHIKADIAAIRNYFRQLQEATTTYFYEAKLLIIGEGGAGKTSLARKLIEPSCDLLPEEESTQGVDILQWSFPLSPDLPGETTDYTANVWDFGGQEIYFATHQFFLTSRSVYVLVADTRRQHTDFYTWLRMQETFGAESPVLLLKNLNRNVGNAFTIQNLHHLRERFPNLKEVIEVDLKEAPDLAGWDDLLHHLKDYLLNLEHIGQPRPRTWVDVRKAVDNHAADTLEWNEFVTLCQEQGMKRDEDIAQLAGYLHNLGDILHFHDDPVLCDLVILKPNWGLDAVYKVLDNQDIIDRLGQFERTDLRTLWSEKRYKGFQEELLLLMQNFQLCYPLESVAHTYIAPQLLTTETPDHQWERHENLQMRYHYPFFMPRGILSRAIVKLHQRIETQEQVWRSGVILNNGHARAEVLEIWGERQIRIRVSGQHKRDLLMEIVRALDELHRGFPKLHFERQIPCNCKTCLVEDEPYFYDFQKVYDRAADRESKGTIECGYRPYADVPLYSLLNDVAAQGLLSGMSEREKQVIQDNRVYNITSDGGAVITGQFQSSGDFAGRDLTKQQTISVNPAQVGQALVKLFALQAAKPTDQASAFETVQALTTEARKGSEADDEELAALIRCFVELVPTGVDVVVAAFRHPPLVEMAGAVTQAVLEELVGAG